MNRRAATRLVTLVPLSLLILAPCASSVVAQQLSESDRLYGLAQVWSEVRANYVHLDAIPFDWDSLFQARLSDARDAHDDFAYYQLLRRMVARLGDSHTRVTPPGPLRSQRLRNFPLRTTLLEGRVIITDVVNDTLQARGFAAGMEILEMDGVPIHDYVRERVMPYEAASTEQDMAVRAYYYELFRGPADGTIDFVLADEDGRLHRLSGERRLTWNLATGTPTVEFEVLPGGVGHLRLNTFDRSSVRPEFDSIYAQVREADALIIDVRANGGGSSTPGYHVLRHLVAEPFPGTHWIARQHLAKLEAGEPSADYYLHRRNTHQPVDDSLRFDGPVALLVGSRTYSAAEDFAAIFDYLDRGPVIGSPSAGSSGEPLRVRLPGGGTLRVVTEHPYYPDGRIFVGRGVQPDILVEETVESVRAGRDVVLEEALRVLRNDPSASAGG